MKETDSNEGDRRDGQSMNGSMEKGMDSRREGWILKCNGGFSVAVRY